MRFFSVKAIIIAVIVLLFGACEQVFEYTPYSAEVTAGRQDTHAKNLAALIDIENQLTPGQSFRFSLVSDSHDYFNDLDDAVSVISKDDESLFVLHGGDLTHHGILMEYNITHHIMSKVGKPWLTVIGNHDFVTNGKIIYEQMFGEMNYTFTFNNCKFVFFNNNIWENYNIEPDFFWLEEALSEAGNYDHVFVIAHIPPWGDQFTALYEQVYQDIVKSAGVSLSIHGHGHTHYYGRKYNDEMDYLIIGTPYKRSFCTVDVFPDTVIVNQIPF